VFTIQKYVLGIDAAWTVKNHSGVALLKWFPKSKPELVRQDALTMSSATLVRQIGRIQ